MVRLRFAGVALCDCISDLFTDRAAWGTVFVSPRQTILFARGADNTLGVLIYSVTFALL